MRQVLVFERRTPLPGPDADGVEHVFAAHFHLGDEHLSGPVHLTSHGLATVVEVEVNGVRVLSSTSMFTAARVEVSTHLHPGVNEVVVRCQALDLFLDQVPRRPRARWRTMLVEEPRLRWLRTSVLGRASGFAPAPPMVGPYRPMVVETYAATQVHRFDLVSTLSAATGVLDIALGITGSESVLVEVSGPDGTVHTVEVPPGAERVRVEVPQVARWWPHSHGAPALYDVRLRHAGTGELLDLPGDATAPTDRRRVGFRALANDAPGSVALRVNDVRIFVRGVVWTPGDLAGLETAVQLGFNLVRVSGVTLYESDAFHHRCDELGLLVWQDLMFATLDYPLADAGFRGTVEAEVRGQCARLLGHPSTVVVCGSAEHEQQAAMAGVRPDSGSAGELARLTRPLVEASGLDVLWVDSSPSGGDLPIRVDTGVAQYFGVGAYLRALPDVRHARVRFASECLAFSNLGDPAVPGGVPRDRGATWDFADVRRHYLRARYGPEPTPAQEQRVTGEVMAEVLGEWRRPGSGCGGAIVLWLRDLEPGSGWGLLDHAGRPKPAALALAPTLQPTAVWIVDEGLNGLDVHVAHDHPGPLDLTLHVALLRADSSVVDEGEVSWSMPGCSHRVHRVESLLGRFADVSHAYRFGPPAHDLVLATLVGANVPLRATWRVDRVVDAGP